MFNHGSGGESGPAPLGFHLLKTAFSSLPFKMYYNFQVAVANPKQKVLGFTITLLS